MPLPAGARLGPYEIEVLIGAGGMGEVYRATDTRLKRQVAVKVLPPAVATEPERLARFQREAELLAALNHPNIAHIHGLEQSGGTIALAMELVDGPTLADRIAQGPVPLGDALPIAKQIAEALEAAHDQGIIHRDLKPANIKVRGDGTVKVLDFGLAKAMDPAGASGANAMNSPTLSLHATEAGVILGTAAYMAPEQARGRTVDRRTDVWAYGVVLFEMLTGTRAFDGGDISATMAFVITKEPDWNALPAGTPATIRTLLRRCLEKDPKRRLQSIGDARLEVEDAASSSATATPAVARKTVPLVVASVAATAVVAAAVTWGLTRPAPPVAPAVTRFAIVPPPAQPLSIFGAARDVAISPDGTLVVYRVGTESQHQLAVRRLDQLDARVLTGMKDAHSPFFSPDGRWIGFYEAADLKKVSVGGGPPIRLSSAGLGTRGFSWADDNTILWATDALAGLLSIPADGGEPKALTKPDAEKHEIGHWFPSVLPDGRGVLFTIAASDAENAQIAVFDPKTGRQKTLVRGGSDAQYVDTGHLVYASGGALHAVRFDLARLEVVGEPVQVVDHVMVANSGEANFAVSRQGTLVYVAGGILKGEQQELVWVDRKGREEPIQAPRRAYTIPRISPDGTRVALQIGDEERDIWTWDLARQTLTRITFDPGLDVQPAWTPDNRRILFASPKGGAFNLYWHAADGTGADVRVTTGTIQQFANSVSPDGAHILGYQNPPGTDGAVMQFDWNGTAQTLLQTKFRTFNVEISPDGHYLAYQSDESGQDEVYVRPYPKVNDARWQVSTGGGTRPMWARNGHELFYVNAARTLVAVPVTTGATFSAGNAANLFEITYSLALPFRTFDVSPDGSRFLMIKDVTAGQAASPAALTVVLNWTHELKTRLP
jgi:serine/threonine-protein kinase